MLAERERFADQMQDAFRQLHNVAALREHALLEIIPAGATAGSKERAFALQQLLLDAVDELRPGPDVPPDSLHWRRYRLLDYRYRKALDPRATARELGISRRQYYRDHGQAMERLVNLLWERLSRQSEEPRPHDAATGSHGDDSASEEERLAMLRVEAARLTRAARTAWLQEVLHGALPLLTRLREAHGVRVDVDLPSVLPEVAIEPSLLRQILLAGLGRLCERAEDGVLRIRVSTLDDAVELDAELEPHSALASEDPQESEERLAALRGMAAPSDAVVRPRLRDGRLCGFELVLPRANRLVLVVDDNEDILALFERHLAAHGYQVATARSADEALQAAEEHQPYAITLDLLMPGVDGWDLLQTLLHRPRTQHIPVIVCSVLRQRELALSLGATAFLIKPVSEQALLQVLGALERPPE